MLRGPARPRHLRELLSRLAAFRAPVEYDVAAVLSPLGGKRELGRAMRELEDRGLLFVVHRKEGFDTIDLLVDGERRRVIQLPEQSLSMPVYSPSGHILYHREPTNPGIWALTCSSSRPSTRAISR